MVQTITNWTCAVNLDPLLSRSRALKPVLALDVAVPPPVAGVVKLPKNWIILHIIMQLHHFVTVHSKVRADVGARRTRYSALRKILCSMINRSLRWPGSEVLQHGSLVHCLRGFVNKTTMNLYCRDSKRR